MSLETLLERSWKPPRPNQHCGNRLLDRTRSVGEVLEVVGEFKFHQKWFQPGSKMALKSILGPLGELLELSWQPGGLLEASWNAVGALLEASGAEKKIS